MKTVKCDKCFSNFLHLTSVKDKFDMRKKRPFCEFLTAVKGAFLTEKTNKDTFPKKSAFPQKVRIAVKGKPKDPWEVFFFHSIH